MKRFNILALLLLIHLSISAFDLQNGDLIFQESRSESDMGDGIKAVTQSADQYHFTHVGIVYIPKKSNTIFVIEATTPRVRMVTLEEYLYPSDSKVKPISVMGRLKAQYQPLISDALVEAKKLIGKGYDYGFVLDNDKYYCSELIYAIFLKANHGQPLFKLNVMTFKSEDSGETVSEWKKYFQKHQLPIPEGECGINPGAMSRSSVLDQLVLISE